MVTISELEALLEKYPWYHQARKQLYQKTAQMGEEYAKVAASKAAIYFFSPGFLLRQPQRIFVKSSSSSSSCRFVGADYFSKDELDSVKDEPLCDGAAAVLESVGGSSRFPSLPDDFFYTETLARIYSQQELHQEAVDVYSKLILKFPEKSTYFATLIDEQKKYL